MNRLVMNAALDELERILAADAADENQSALHCLMAKQNLAIGTITIAALREGPGDNVSAILFALTKSIGLAIAMTEVDPDRVLTLVLDELEAIKSSHDRAGKPLTPKRYDA